LKTHIGKLYLFAAFALAGSSVVAARFISAYIPPFTITFLSLFWATVTAILFCGKKMLLTVRSLSHQTWLVLFLQALFGSFLFRVFLTIGLLYIGAAQAGVITGATPAITALFTFLILRERLDVHAALGLLITLIGILLVQGFPFHITDGNMQFKGFILVFCAAACESLFTILARKIQLNVPAGENLSPVVQAGLVSILAMLLCIAPMLFEGSREAVISLPLSGWLALIWYGSIVTVVAFACMFAGAKRCSGYTIAGFAGFVPISSLVLSIIFLKETVYIYQIVGCILVVGAAYILSLRR